MKSMDSIYNIDGQPYISIINDFVIEASQSFIDMTEYKAQELLNKNIAEVLRILRVNPDVDIEDIDEEVDYFLFTKSLEVRFVSIKAVKEIDGTKLFITEISNSRFEDKHCYLHQLLSYNITAIGVYSVPSLILLTANQAYLDYFDTPYNIPENTVGRYVAEYTPGWKGSYVEEVWENVITSGRPWQIKEYKHNEFSRGETYWDVTVTPIKEDGRVKYIVSNPQEVTESVLNRNKVQEQMEDIELKNKQLEAIIESIQDNISIIDKQGRFLRKSNVINKVFEPTDEDIWTLAEKTNSFDMDGNPFPKEDLCGHRLLRGQSVKNLRLRLVSGSHEAYMQFSGIPIFNENREFEMGVMFGADITEAVNLAKQIRHQNGQLKAIIDSMSDGLMLTDDKMHITFLNQAAKDFIYNFNEKVSPDDLLKYSKYYYGIDGELIPRQDLPAYRIFNKGKFQDYILTVECPGKKIYASVNGSPIYDCDGTAREAILYIRDITEHMVQRKIIEYHQELALKAEREKNEALEKAIEVKDEFLSLISHEFRTPLTVINTAIQALNSIYADEMTEKVKKYIGTIRQNTYRQLRLVNNLLDITRANAGRIKVYKKNIDIVVLTKAITESVCQYAAQKGVKLAFASDFDVKTIGIDDEKYERILLNLLSNAIKFTPEGKSISVRLYSSGGSICVEVRDTGIGIPPDKIDVIFERFGQVDSLLSRQAEGTGIGLALVKKFVEALGGSISLKSKAGRGSAFTILLPDEMVIEEHTEKHMVDLIDNRLVQSINVEFSDIYL